MFRPIIFSPVVPVSSRWTVCADPRRAV